MKWHIVVRRVGLLLAGGALTLLVDAGLLDAELAQTLEGVLNRLSVW